MPEFGKILRFSLIQNGYACAELERKVQFNNVENQMNSHFLTTVIFSAL